MDIRENVYSLLRDEEIKEKRSSNKNSDNYVSFYSVSEKTSLQIINLNVDDTLKLYSSRR